MSRLSQTYACSKILFIQSENMERIQRRNASQDELLSVPRTSFNTFLVHADPPSPSDIFDSSDKKLSSEKYNARNVQILLLGL